MKQISRTRALAVISAAALILILAGALAARVSARGAELDSSATPPPPRAEVPAPTTADISQLPDPFCWGCAWNQDVALEFQVDLDLLAPLGNGAANAAEWFKDFASGGPRFDPERFANRKVTRTIDGDEWSVFRGDDPLLLEAEPWVDQATCHFYPDVWPISFPETRVPQLLLMLDLARSWVVRGKLSDDPHAAQEDYRRAIRLGRLLRQDDVTLIQDLVAIATIRIGAEAMYQSARQEGDAKTMLLTALVLADKDAMRQLTARRITILDRVYAIDDSGARPVPVVRLSDDELDSILDVMRTWTDRRFKMEGLIGLAAVSQFGTTDQQRVAREALEEFAAIGDPIMVELIQYFRENPLTADALREMAGM